MKSFQAPCCPKITCGGIYLPRPMKAKVEEIPVELEVGPKATTGEVVVIVIPSLEKCDATP